MRHRAFTLLAAALAAALLPACASRAPSHEASLPPALAGAAAPTPALLPLPASVRPLSGRFTLDAATFISIPPGDAAARNAAARFVELLRATGGPALAIREQRGGSIRFARRAPTKAEAYALTVTTDGATIAAGDAAGLFYGGVTLWQLLTADDTLSTRATAIEDAPRFGWRGLMLDSARHYQSPAFIKRFIDAMAAAKLNVFHWHLTDDQGWRLQIKKYPRLTEAGGWRVPAGRGPASDIDPATGRQRVIGGFYTQAEVREIVAYAAARQVTIVPEINVPGHATAAIAAYPALGTLPSAPATPSSDWGVFANLYNVEESTFAFLEDVIAEVVELFPGSFVHIGGDEAIKDQWRASPRIQARMSELGVKDEAALQGYVNRRLQQVLARHGRRLIGWDEILEGGLPGDAAVMSWRGIDGAVTAAAQGHDTVLSPAPTLYLDHRQASTPAEPPGRGKVIALRDVYDFDPAPERLSAEQRRHVLGLQGNLWTEHVRTEARAAHQAFPRGLAIADIGWAPPAAHGWTGFVDRLLPQLDRLKRLGIEAAPSAFAVQSTERVTTRDAAEVSLASQAGVGDIRYTLDGSAPTAASPRYAGPLSLRLPVHLRATAFKHGRALPGALDRRLDAGAVRRRDDSQLATCTDKLTLALEDDAPVRGDRAVMLTDIMNPCWRYDAAPLDGVTAIELTVGQLPFNFQIGADRDKIRFRPPATPAGEFEVRLGCDGERIAVLPLAPAAARDGTTVLRAPIDARSGVADLCLTYTARGVEPMWAVDAVQLILGPASR